MRRRILILLAVLVVIGLLVFVRPTTGHAAQAWVHDLKSDCQTLSAGITMSFITDDGGNKDYFRIELYDDTNGGLITGWNLSVRRDQSPYYWETGPLLGAAEEGLYRMELFDVDAAGNKQRYIDQVYHSCITGASWRSNNPIDDDPNIPNPTCYLWMPIYTVNTAPDDGTVMVMWSQQESSDWQAINFHAATISVAKGDRLEGRYIQVPCGVYVKVFYQFDSTNLVYFMPSQYQPGDYGTPNDGRLDINPADTNSPSYHTAFP